MEQQKTKISADFLYQFIKEHNIILSKIAEKMGVSYSIVNRSFRHGKDRLGKPIYFSAANLVKLNQAISEIAAEIRNCQLHFGSSQTFTNQHGKTYDPALVEGFRMIGQYFKLSGLTNNVLGWNVTKNNTTLSVQKSPVYGNITREDADRINAELLAVAGVLSSYEVVPEESPSPTLHEGEGAQVQTADTKQNERGTRKGVEPSFKSPSYSWDDTSIHLQERSRLYREQYAQGVLLFRVNGGYTAEGDDAWLVNQLDGSIHPYTDATSGMTTAYMDSEQMSNILPRLIAQDRHVMFTDMYDKEK